MQRLSGLPGNALEAAVSGIEKIANELKSRQLVSSASLQFFTSSTDQQYDWQGTLPPSSAGATVGLKKINVFATAQNMDVLYGGLIVYLYINGQPYSYSQVLAAQKANASAIVFNQNLFNLTLSASQRNVIGSMLTISGNVTDTVGIKVYALASDTALITTQQVN